MTPAFAAWLRPAALVDAVLAMMLIEAVTVATLYQRTGRGIPVRELAPNLLSGALILLGLRATLAGSPALMPAWLGAALLAHLADIAVRWRS